MKWATDHIIYLDKEARYSIYDGHTLPKHTANHVEEKYLSSPNALCYVINNATAILKLQVEHLQFYHTKSADKVVHKAYRSLRSPAAA